jgi:hypothetical protein
MADARVRFVEHRIACIFTFRQRLFEKLPDGEGALSVAGSERATVAGGHERKEGLSQRCAETVFFEAGGGRARGGRCAPRRRSCKRAR